MKRSILLTPSAAAEFEAAVEWYEKEHTGTGGRFKHAVLAAIAHIQDHPLAYPRIYRALRRARVKSFPYSIMYSMEPAAIRVIAVFHASRDSSEWESRVRE